MFAFINVKYMYEVDLNVSVLWLSELEYTSGNTDVLLFTQLMSLE